MVRDVSPEELMEIIGNSRVVLVDCWAAWCGPCRALTPILQELEKEYSDNPDVTIVKLNVDEHREFAMEHQITAIPCVLVYRDGKPARIKLYNPVTEKYMETDRIVGLREIDDYEEVIEQLIEQPQ